MDWDYPYPGKRETLKRIYKLSVYFLSRYIPHFRKYCEEVYNEHKLYTEIYNELEKLTGQKMIYGIRPDVKQEFNQFIKDLEKKHDTRLHLHMWFEEDREIFKEKFGEKPTGHLVAWIPKFQKNILIDPSTAFLDFRKSEKDIKNIKKEDIVVFHPDYKGESLLLYLKLLNHKKGR